MVLLESDHVVVYESGAGPVTMEMEYNGELSVLSLPAAKVLLLLQDVSAAFSLGEGSHKTYSLFREVLLGSSSLVKANWMQVL